MRLPQMNTCYSARHTLCWRERERGRDREGGLCFTLYRPSMEISLFTWKEKSRNLHLYDDKSKSTYSRLISLKPGQSSKTLLPFTIIRRSWLAELSALAVPIGRSLAGAGQPALTESVVDGAPKPAKHPQRQTWTSSPDFKVFQEI